MKRINKAIIFVLIISLLICPVMAVSSNDELPKDSEFDGLVTLLSELDIISGISEISHSGVVTRSQFVTMVVNMLSMKNNLPAPGSAPFLDVPITHTAERHIALAAQMGIAQGTGEGFFSPDQEISTEEAVTILVTVLGYKVTAENNGGYPMGYLSTARSIKLWTGGYDQGGMTWQTAVKLLYSSFDVDIQIVSAVIGETTQLTVAKGKNLLQQNRNIYVTEGVINANGMTRLDEGSDIRDNTVEIDGVLYLINNTNADKFLGYSVEAYYYMGSSSDDKSLVSLYFKSNRNKELFLAEEEIKNYDQTERRYTYYKDDRNLNASISVLAKVIYNNAIASMNFRFEPENGSVRMIDNDNDGIYDVVFIEDYYNIIVDYVSTLDEKVYDKIRQTPFSLASELDREVIIKNTDGADVKLNELTTWNVLSVFTSTLASKELIYIRVSTDNAKGVISEINNDIVIADGKEYELSKLYKESLSAVSNDERVSDAMPRLMVSDRVDLYFDYMGKIAGAYKQPSEDGAYVYIINFDTVYGIESKLRLKVYNCLAQQIEVKDVVSKGLTIDGIAASNIENALTRLKEANFEYSRLNPSVPVVLNAPDGISQLVYCKFKGEEIKSIDTLISYADDESENGTYDDNDDGLHLITSGTRLTYKSNTKAFSNRMIMDGNTFILSIPGSNGTPSDNLKDQPDNRFARSAATVFTNATRYNVTGYTREKDSPIAEILLTTEGGGSELNADSHIYIISSISKAITSDGVNSYKLYLKSFNSEISATLAEREKFSYTLDGVQKQYKVGDFVRFSLDDNKEITAIELVFDGTTFITTPVTVEGEYTSKPGVETHFGGIGEGNITSTAQTYASLYRVIGKNKSIIQMKQLNAAEAQTEYHVGNLYNVYIVDLADKNNPVIKGGVGDVTAESVDPENSVIFLYMQWLEARVIFVLKNSPLAAN